MKRSLSRLLLVGMLATLGVAHLRAATTLGIAPASTSNTFTGNLTFTINGLTSGQAVEVTGYLDLNANGVIDANEPLTKGFFVRDGQTERIGSSTNFNRPRDLDGATNGAVTTALSFLNENDTERFIGRFLFRTYDSNGVLITGATNTFTITNFPYSQMVTGLVKHVTNVPNAMVALLQQGASGNTHFITGSVANNSGAYAVMAPAGGYQLVAIRAGYVVDFNASPFVNLGAGQTLVTNLNLTNTSRTISGRVVDAANTNRGLPGVQLFIQSTNNLFTIAWTDATGNFSAGVTPSQWEIDSSDTSVALLGYAGLSGQARPQVDTTSGNVSGLLVKLQKTDSIFFGTVRDNLGNVVPALQMYASDGTNNAFGLTDTNGVYAVGAVTGIWYLNLSEDDLGDKGYVGTSGTNFNFSSGNQSVQADFTVLRATATITGSVKDTNTIPITDLDVFASAVIGGKTYYAHGRTDDSGNYTLRVATNATWFVGVNCNDLGSRGFGCPNTQTTNIPPTNAVVNFVVLPPQPLQVDTASLPDGMIGLNYNASLVASGGSPSYQWFVIPAGGLPAGLSLDQFSGTISGTPISVGTSNFTVQVFDQVGGNATRGLSITVQPSGPLQLTTVSLPDGEQNCYYSQAIQASGGAPPYMFSLALGSLPLPPGMNLSSNGTLSGIPATFGFTNFVVQVKDSLNATASGTVYLFLETAVGVATTSLPHGTVGTFFSLYLNSSNGTFPQTWTLVSGGLPPNLTFGSDGLISGTPVAATTSNFTVRVADSCSFATQMLSLTIDSQFVITTTSLPPAIVNLPYSAQVQAIGGQMPYTFSLAAGSSALPGGLILDPSGLITGMVSSAGSNAFIVQVNDSGVNQVTRGFFILSEFQPTLDLPTPLASNRFQFRLNGTPGQSYTIQFNTTLASNNWVDLLSTNAPGAAFMVNDPGATNSNRVYRVRVN